MSEKYDQYDENEGIDCIKGCLFALPIGIILWILIIWAIKAIFYLFG